MLALERFRAKFENGRANHPDTRTVQRWTGLDAGHFFQQDLVFVTAEASAAIFRGPFRSCPASLAHTLQPQTLVFALVLEVTTTPASVLFASKRGSHALGAVLFKPRPGFLTEGFQISHACSPWGSGPGPCLGQCC